ncbi:hypothetical protein O1611_g4027 [Lasiodiplodia mahajangana]|uniref:Uncharacterized protein n=1 Tax=Lasiodiplodia mahajangana TaxID=1108764 RepID=A0ACC2JQ26_9PEZI|nr:hypothetical protein O1611_g4027 [Lasiodiplodia mahajangana]
MGITPNSKHCWNAENLDEFVSSMSMILWCNILYDQRSRILSADIDANSGHLDRDGGDCAFCREVAYRTCAIRLVASVLNDNEARYAAAQAFQWKKGKGTGFSVQLTPPQLITNKLELPTWVRCPQILEVSLQERVVNIIKSLSHSTNANWHLNITTHERVKIIHAMLQRRFNKRIIVAVETKRPMAALFHLFQPKYVLTLRSKLSQEIQARRNRHPSKWHQANGIWMVVKYVLLKLLEDCGQFDKSSVPTKAKTPLLSWFKHHLKRKDAWYHAASSSSRRKSWRKYSV